MKNTKKILAIVLTMIVLATMFIGCKKEEESQPVNGTEPVSVETVDDVIDEMIEDVSIEETKKDEDGNNVVVGTDGDGNTVEVKTDKDGNITKTITDKNTGKKTEQTTVVTTTKKQETTIKKSQTKTETTTKKVNKTTTTTKPNSTTTTAHKHNYEPVYKTEKVKVKDAYDEPVYKETQAYYCSGCGIECVTEAKKYGVNYSVFHMRHSTPKRNDGIIPLCPEASNTDAPYLTSGKTFNKPMTVKIQTGTKHHDAVYEDRKVVDYYKCSCGATKK